MARPRPDAAAMEVSRRSPWSEEESLISHDLEELDRVSARITKAAMQMNVEISRMHQSLVFIASSKQEPNTGTSGKARLGSFTQHKRPGPQNLHAQRHVAGLPRSEVEKFDPCDFLRLRLNLRPTDTDFESLEKDRTLRIDFKQALKIYVHEVLKRYEGDLPLQKLKVLAVAHVRSRVKMISTAPKEQRRMLLEYVTLSSPHNEKSLIGGLEAQILQASRRGPTWSSKIHEQAAGHQMLHPSRVEFVAKLSEDRDIPALRKFSNDYRHRTNASTTPKNAGINSQAADYTMDLHRQRARFKRPQTESDANPAPSSGKRESEFVGADWRQQRASQSSSNLNSIIRWRELGGGSLNCLQMHERHLNRQLQCSLLQQLRPWRKWGQASKDILTTVWSPDGRHFAVGASADMDDLNIQYNEPRNLLYGDIESNKLFELADHRLARPLPATVSSGDNARQDMYNMMDPHLYATVSGICFSPNGRRMYTSSYDRCVKIWDASQSKPACLQTLHHKHQVQLLDVSSSSHFLATGTDARSDSIRLYQLSENAAALSRELQSDRAIHGQYTLTCLRFGPSKLSSHLLLAGFGETRDEFGQREREGALELWDVRESTLMHIKLSAAGRNVSDAAWHPHDPYFAAALATDVGDVQANRRGTKSFIRTWSPLNGPSKIREFDCPALDVNELRFHPHRPDYITASCTNGASYLWDARMGDDPVICLQHDEPIDPLDPQLIRGLGYDRAREEADTGVKLVTWDRDGQFLYTGSSDGKIIQWNPWVATEDARVTDVSSYDSHIMAGAYSPDHSHLLVGTARGAVHILSSAPLNGSHVADHDTLYDLEPMQFEPAEGPGADSESNEAAKLVASGQISVHPYLGAGQGDMYSGPYAAWARTGAVPSDLAKVDLDANVLANQLDPMQWRKGLGQGGVPTTNVRERQEWLSRQMTRASAETEQRSKRDRASSPTSSPTASAANSIKRMRPLDTVFRPVESASALPTGNESVTASEVFIPVEAGALLRREGHAPDLAHAIPTALDLAFTQTRDDHRQAPLEPPPPSPLPTRLKESPKSESRSRCTPGLSQRPRASFQMPPPIPIFGARHSRTAAGRSIDVGPRRSSNPPEREIIVIDDSD